MGFSRGPNIVRDGLVFALDAGAVRSYPGSGTTAYSLVDSNTGTLTNGVSFQTNNGGTFDFDGTDDAINFNGISILNSIGVTSGADNDVAYSMEAWFKLDNYPAGIGVNGDSIMGHKDPYGIGLQAFGNGSTAYINFGYRNNNNYDSSNISINAWHHVVGTREVGGYLRIYIDGEDDYAVTGDLKVDYTTTDFGVGNSSNRIGPFDGSIASTRIYSRALTAEEVSQNYNAQKSRFGL